jgi:hypothetical protein
MQPPTQGFVLEWRRHSYKWFALVRYVQEGKDLRLSTLSSGACGR